MERTVNQVIEQITEILINFCNEEETITKWKKEFVWFDEIDKNSHTKYWNLAPECIEEIKWKQMGIIMNMFIKFPVTHAHNEWEKMVVNVFLNKEKITDEIYPLIDEHGTEWYDANTTMEQYNDYIEYMKEYRASDEYQEEMQLAKQERAASRHSKY